MKTPIHPLSASHLFRSSGPVGHFAARTRFARRRSVAATCTPSSSSFLQCRSQLFAHYQPFSRIIPTQHFSSTHDPRVICIDFSTLRVSEKSAVLRESFSPLPVLHALSPRTQSLAQAPTLAHCLPSSCALRANTRNSFIGKTRNARNNARSSLHSFARKIALPASLPPLLSALPI
jgi:hypothetical protein